MGVNAMKKKSALRIFWQLFRGYWNSEHKWRARGLLAFVIGLNFVGVYLLVRLNSWYNEFYNALQQYQVDLFWPLIGEFTLVAMLYILIAVYAIYLRQAVQIVFLYFGWLPEKLTDVSPFHGSLVITDLGSLGIPPVYHHLYDFGNVPIFIAFGAKRRVNELGSDGSVIPRTYLDYTVASDERICDGYNFARSLKYMRGLLQRPEELETPPEFVLQDVD